MSYLNFDKTLLMNLEKSITKELIRTNRAGTYSSSTLIECNTRKYHGQLVVPLPEIDDSNHVLLSSLDETIIQHGAEFNLGIHMYPGNNFNPNGHRYIREFTCDTIPRTIYRIGGVILQKERILVSNEPRILFKYTLLDAHSPTTIRFKPFLAFRSVNELTRQNNIANTAYHVLSNGISMKLYEGYPNLCMQFSRKNIYYHQPDWYKGIVYWKEQERGYDFQEDLLVPGYFEMPIKKGESIIISAGTSEISTRSLNSLWEKELEKRHQRADMFSTLKNAAHQLYNKKGDKTYILAGFPWFGARARDQFISLVPSTLLIGREDYFDAIMSTSLEEVEAFLAGKRSDFALKDLDAPDNPLWFIRSIQQYAELNTIEKAAERFGDICIRAINHIKKQGHPNLFMHKNNLLYVNGTEKPATWMDAVEYNMPITPRTGYVVEINALWFNAMKFVAQLEREVGNDQSADLLDYQAEIAKESFIAEFWNGAYLNDYAVNGYKDKEVRPNMIIAAGLPFSPLDRQQMKSVVDIATKELLTPKGLRTLSPKSGSYRPEYIGGMQERNWNYHNGPVWPWTIAYYTDAYLKIYKNGGKSFIERLLSGLETEMTELCVGTISELYDGNPPFKGHGGMSFAMSVAEILRAIDILKKEEEKEVNL